MTSFDCELIHFKYKYNNNDDNTSIDLTDLSIKVVNIDDINMKATLIAPKYIETLHITYCCGNHDSINASMISLLSHCDINTLCIGGKAFVCSFLYIKNNYKIKKIIIKNTNETHFNKIQKMKKELSYGCILVYENTTIECI